MDDTLRDELRARIAGAIDEHGPGIVQVADQIHQRPEIGFEERFASGLLADALRGQGYEAYFHHDEDRRLSMVTVGLFDKTAIDPESGIWAPEVKLLVRRFPARLVNGEPLREPVSRFQEDLGTRVQEPKLVLVPEL